MILFAIIWVGIGLMLLYTTWTGYKNGEYFAIAGISIPIYLWYAFDLPTGIIVGLFPVLAFICCMFCPSYPKPGSWYEKEVEKRREAASKVGPALSLAEHMYMLSKGIR